MIFVPARHCVILHKQEHKPQTSLLIKQIALGFCFVWLSIRANMILVRSVALSIYLKSRFFRGKQIPHGTVDKQSSIRLNDFPFLNSASNRKTSWNSALIILTAAPRLICIIVLIFIVISIESRWLYETSVCLWADLTMIQRLTMHDNFLFSWFRNSKSQVQPPERRQILHNSFVCLLVDLHVSTLLTASRVWCFSICLENCLVW